ncbi:Tox-REase-5 domain-containing protein [Xenorhabdus sp. PB30.3]|uniref:Tox-REase-5 domain-containing protein n=1 Tax=Xenorhabdus sp. PB30.3 TaxID=2788941 RepID=UPI001E63A86B|nr:Tox-REase-5 domain-containing protein [Xenorhabdus sp. PB30.3]MCC8379085.1 hypothetical protein [Xenorhabdus sp. PB30.3]
MPAPLVIGAPAAGAALLAAAEWTLAACVAGLAAVGIIDSIDDAPDNSKNKERDEEKDIKDGETSADARLAKIEASGSLARSREECKSCPASTGVTEIRKAKYDINFQYQIFITKHPCGDNWVKEWNYASVSFDGFQISSCLLQETKAKYDNFFIEDRAILKFWSGAIGIIAQAKVQSSVVSATPPNKLSWYFMQPKSFAYYKRLFAGRGYVMTVHHVPMA